MMAAVTFRLKNRRFGLEFRFILPVPRSEGCYTAQLTAQMRSLIHKGFLPKSHTSGSCSGEQAFWPGSLGASCMARKTHFLAAMQSKTGIPSPLTPFTCCFLKNDFFFLKKKLQFVAFTDFHNANTLIMANFKLTTYH